MPVRLTNAPAAFQWLMQQVLMGSNPKNGNLLVSGYIDDFLQEFRGASPPPGTGHEAGESETKTKRQFLRQEVEYLVTPEGLKTSQQYVQAVQEFPQPRDVKGVHRLMGLASY